MAQTIFGYISRSTRSSWNHWCEKKQDRVVNPSGFKMLLECRTALLSLSLFVLFSCCSRYVAFVKLIDLNGLLDNDSFDQSEA